MDIQKGIYRGIESYLAVISQNLIRDDAFHGIPQDSFSISLADQARRGNPITELEQFAIQLS